jgi:DNA primase
MALYKRDSIDRMRDAVDMVELVGHKTDLRRVGSRWVGLCPFHDERTPSFSVNAVDKLFYCFGCEAKGDAIGFVQQTEALDFREATEFLAERYGVELELEDEDPGAERRRRRRERLLALLDRTAKFYAAYLWDSGEAERARAYLAERGFDEEVLREFRVGYSPSAWDRVSLAARRDGFDQEELMAAGLAQSGRGGSSIYDRFRGRIMFPLADARGRVLGFGARSMGEGRGPKYLNTSENELYHKGRQLFGIDQARAHAAKAGRVIVVEGYTDVLALHQSGVREAVAIMGTALTPEQLALLSQAAPLVLLALDADKSGQEAMLRAARAASDRGLELRVVGMPEGRDPADMLAEGDADSFFSRLERAVPVTEFEVGRVLADADLDTPAGRDRAFEEARPLITATPERTATRDELVRLVADRLDVPVGYVTTKLSSPPEPAVAMARASAPPRAAAPDLASPGAASLAAERAFLAMCLASGDLGRGYLGRLREGHLSSDMGRRAAEHVLAHFDDPLDGLGDDDPALAALVTGAAMQASEQEGHTEAVLRMSFLQLEQRRVERELRRAREEGDFPRQDELAGVRQQVRRELDSVMGQTA